MSLTRPVLWKMMFSPMAVREIAWLINKHNRFVVSSHVGPDGDAIGSCYGLALALNKIGKTVDVVLDSYSSKFDIIPGKNFRYTGELSKLDPEIVIALDCADIERLGSAKELFLQAQTTVCIDHHDTNKGFAHYNFLDSNASSTGEMVFALVDELTDIDNDIACAIYAAIICDTGGFRHMNTNAPALDIAGRLVSMGIPFTAIYNELMHMHSFISAKALGLTLNNLSQSADGRIVFSYMTLDLLSSVGADTSDLDGVAGYLMSTQGAEVAFFVYEKRNIPAVKVSMRSKKVNVGRIAASLGGGGHNLAAGCSIVGDVEEVLEKVLTIFEKELENDASLALCT